MYRISPPFLASSTSSLFNPALCRMTLSRLYSSSTPQTPPNLSLSEINAPDSQNPATEARNWVTHFKDTKIPRGYVDITFSRSSGPGGQNVNKLSTKATVRCSLYEKWIPVWARDGLQESPFYAPSSQTILIKSDVSRSQSSNAIDCLEKLHNLILTAATSPIRNVTPESTKKRVEGFQKAAERRRKEEKMKRSTLKKGRKPDDW